MEKSVTFTGACANEMIPNGQFARLLTKRKKEVMLESTIVLDFVARTALPKNIIATQR